MYRRHRYLSGLLLLLILAGCTGSAAPTPPAPATIVPTLPPPTLPPPTLSGPCTVTAQTAMVVYQRPGFAAAQFGMLAAGDMIVATMRGENGWLGFDPGVAQAANVGVFRLRWIAPEADMATVGDCAGLPLAPPLSPTACYFMALAETPVHAAPDAGSNVVATIPASGYSAVSGVDESGWYALLLEDGSLGLNGGGWLNPLDANFNGACGALPDA